MPKKDMTAAAETAPEEAVSEEKTVTLPQAQLDAIMADLTLMKQKLASEEREKSVTDKQRAREKAMIAQTEKANAEAEEEVDYYVDLGAMRSNKNVEVSINGKQYIVPRGVPVRVPRAVKEVIENAIRQREVSLGMQEEKSAVFEKANVTGALTL